jgi:hypothetical protein
MKSLVEVLRQKELELQQIQSEVDALRIALRLVSEEGETYGRPSAPTGTLPESREARVTEITASPTATRQFP